MTRIAHIGNLSQESVFIQNLVNPRSGVIRPSPWLILINFYRS